MKRRRLMRSCFSFSIIATSLIGLPGCGGSSETATNSSPTAIPTSAAMVDSTVVAKAAAAPATDVVSQFLDLVRRGGSDTGAEQLLTTKAQSELQRIGRTVQPIGSPDARFEVTRAESIPDSQDAALVHSVWTEPNQDGSVTQIQAVWAVQIEQNQWRISGLALETAPNEDPMVINFEDGNAMDQILAANDTPTETEGAEVTQAQAAQGTLAR